MEVFLCEKCGRQMAFIKDWIVQGGAIRSANGQAKEGQALLVSLYKCGNGHQKRRVEKVE